MRKLIMWNVLSLDGFFEGENPWDLNFHNLVWGEELEEFSREQLNTADMLLFGKNTYKGMAEHWSKAGGEEGEIAAKMNSIRKVVCSSQLTHADWNNTTIVHNAVEGITKLKKEGVGNIYVFGSGQLSNSLIKAGLFDEFRLCISPVFLGRGKRLFNEGIPYNELQLVETRQLKTGGVILLYKKA